MQKEIWPFNKYEESTLSINIIIIIIYRKHINRKKHHVYKG